MAQQPASEEQTGDVKDFDFLFGRWDVKHRRLAQREAGSGEWTRFAGIAETRGLLGGVANIEENLMPGTDASGVALRLFDPNERRWSIYWVSGIDGKLQPPVVGRFDRGVGIFEGSDQDQGRPIRVRYTWDRTETGSPRWQQAFSWDEGSSWETNWVMEFSSRED